eukprot:955187_1
MVCEWLHRTNSTSNILNKKTLFTSYFDIRLQTNVTDKPGNEFRLNGVYPYPMAALWYKETREVVCNYRIVLGDKKKNENKESRKQKKRRKKEEEEEPAVDRIVTAVEHTHTLGKGDIASKHHTTRDRIVSVWKGDIASHNHTTGDRIVSVWQGAIASPHHTTGDRIVSVWKGDIASHNHTTGDRIVSVWRDSNADNQYPASDHTTSVWKGNINIIQHPHKRHPIAIPKQEIQEITRTQTQDITNEQQKEMQETHREVKCIGYYAHTHTHPTEHNKMNAKRTETQFILAQQKIPENSKMQPSNMIHKQQMQLNEKPQNESNIKQSMTWNEMSRRKHDSLSPSDVQFLTRLFIHITLDYSKQRHNYSNTATFYSEKKK